MEVRCSVAPSVEVHSANSAQAENGLVQTHREHTEFSCHVFGEVVNIEVVDSFEHVRREWSGGLVKVSGPTAQRPFDQIGSALLPSP
jgi:hypothetical protein